MGNQGSDCGSIRIYSGFVSPEFEFHFLSELSILICVHITTDLESQPVTVTSHPEKAMSTPSDHLGPTSTQSKGGCFYLLFHFFSVLLPYFYHVGGLW